MGVHTQTAMTARPGARPLTLSANGRKLSYRSKSGNILTMELKNSSKASDGRKGLTLTKISSRDTDDKATDEQFQPQGMLPDLFDTLCFWCTEAIEVAAFGPYNEPK